VPSSARNKDAARQFTDFHGAFDLIEVITRALRLNPANS
jgi:hypothetical protein